MPSLAPDPIAALPEKDGTIPAPATMAAPELPKETKAVKEKAHAMIDPDPEKKGANAEESAFEDQIDPPGKSDPRPVEQKHNSDVAAAGSDPRTAHIPNPVLPVAEKVDPARPPDPAPLKHSKPIQDPSPRTAPEISDLDDNKPAGVPQQVGAHPPTIHTVTLKRPTNTDSQHNSAQNDRGDGDGGEGAAFEDPNKATDDEMDDLDAALAMGVGKASAASNDGSNEKMGAQAGQQDDSSPEHGANQEVSAEGMGTQLPGEEHQRAEQHKYKSEGAAAAPGQAPNEPPAGQQDKKPAFIAAPNNVAPVKPDDAASLNPEHPGAGENASVKPADHTPVFLAPIPTILPNSVPAIIQPSGIGVGISLHGTTLTPNAPGITVSNVPISLDGSYTLHYGFESYSLPTLSLPPPSLLHTPTPTLDQLITIIANQPLTANPTALILETSTTLRPGLPGTTISGTLVSLAPSGVLIVGTSSVRLGGSATSPTSVAGLGTAILRGSGSGADDAEKGETGGGGEWVASKGGSATGSATSGRETGDANEQETEGASAGAGSRGSGTDGVSAAASTPVEGFTSARGRVKVRRSCEEIFGSVLVVILAMAM